MYSSISPQIYQKTDTLNDGCYLKRHAKDNAHINRLQTENYRIHDCKKVNFDGAGHPLYHHFNVVDGAVGGCNIMTDDQLTRGSFQTKPLDKLNERITEKRYYDYLPRHTGMIPHPTTPVSNVDQQGLCSNAYGSNACYFQTKTTASVNPQTGFNPMFDRIGMNSRDHGRKNAYFYKKQARMLSRKTMGSHGRFSQFKM